jgi:SnoaL-like domain
MDITDLAHAVRRLQDRQELRDLTLRYCRAIDDSDWAALRGMFADRAGIADAPDAPGGDEIVDQLRAIRSTYGRTIHTAHGQLVEFTDDDHATGMVPSHAELDIKGETVVCAMRYYDDYVREADGWRFARRQIKFTYALPWPRMDVALTEDLPVHWPGTQAAPPDRFPGTSA